MWKSMYRKGMLEEWVGWEAVYRMRWWWGNGRKGRGRRGMWIRWREGENVMFLLCPLICLSLRLSLPSTYFYFPFTNWAFRVFLYLHYYTGFIKWFLWVIHCCSSLIFSHSLHHHLLPLPPRVLNYHYYYHYVFSVFSPLSIYIFSNLFNQGIPFIRTCITVTTR